MLERNSLPPFSLLFTGSFFPTHIERNFYFHLSFKAAAHLGGIVEGNCKLKEQNQPQSETAQTSANTETGTIAFSQIVVETLVPPFPLRRTRLPIYSAVERSSYLWLRTTQCATVFYTPRCSLQPFSFLLRSEWFTCLQQQRRFDSLISLC